MADPNTFIHFRLPNPRDSRIAACDEYWCAHNSDDWVQVNCPECLAIHEKRPVRQVFRVSGKAADKDCPAFFGHARQEWDHKTQAYRYVNVVREVSP